MQRQKEYGSNDPLYATLSLGYLVHRQGNWFNPSTFKFSIIGVQVKNLGLTPEVVWSKFFQHFSPTLKLTLEIE